MREISERLLNSCKIMLQTVTSMPVNDNHDVKKNHGEERKKQNRIIFVLNISNSSSFFLPKFLVETAGSNYWFLYLSIFYETWRHFFSIEKTPPES